MPLVTRILMPSMLLSTFILLIFDIHSNFQFYFFADLRPISDIVLFVIIGLTDLQKEERKGSVFLAFEYVAKILVLAGVYKVFSFGFSFFLAPDFALARTSYPLLFCLTIAFRDMILKPNEQRYFLISAFKIKYFFYPIFLSILLEFIKLRIDILVALVVSILGILIKADRFLIWICGKIDKKIVSNKTTSLGLIPTKTIQEQQSDIDKIKTNSSIAFHQNA